MQELKKIFLASTFLLLMGQNGQAMWEGEKEISSSTRKSFQSSAEEGSSEAIHRKIEELTQKTRKVHDGGWGNNYVTRPYSPEAYQKNLQFAKELNERLVEKGDSKAITRKIKNAWYGGIGYNPTFVEEKRNITDFDIRASAPEEKRNASDFDIRAYKSVLHPPSQETDLEEKGDVKAIEIKIEEVALEKHVYEKNPQAARKLNDGLVEKGNTEAIERKVEGLLFGRHNYEEKRVVFSSLRGELETLNSFNTSNHGHIELPLDILHHLFNLLDIGYLGRMAQLSSYWARVNATSDLWRNVGLTRYADYLSSEILQEDPRQTVIWHYLCVLANMKNSLDIEYNFIHRHNLYMYNPLDNYTHFLAEFVHELNNHSLVGRDDVASYGVGRYKYDPNFERRRAAVGDPQALEIIATASRYAPFRPNIGRKLNEYLVSIGNRRALERRANLLQKAGIGHREYVDWDFQLDCIRTSQILGYKRDPQIASELSKILIQRGYSAAILRKMLGFTLGIYSCNIDSEEVEKLNFILNKAEDSKLFEHPVIGFALGKYYGYEKDPDAARKLNDELAEQGDLVSMMIKLEGVEPFPIIVMEKEATCKQVNLLPSGHRESDVIKTALISHKFIMQKLFGLLKGGVSYQAIVGANDWAPIYEEKQYEGYGYKKNLFELRNYIEELTADSNWETRALGRYLKVIGLKNGTLGYTKNWGKAIEYIKQYNVPL